MKQAITLVFAMLMLFGCHRAKQTVKDAINETGVVAGKGASEFASGVYTGVDETFKCSIETSKALTDKGFNTGKFKLSHDTLLVVYCTFDSDFNNKVMVKVFDSKGQEYGRTTTIIKAGKAEAGYYNFSFKQPTRLESQSKFVFDTL